MAAGQGAHHRPSPSISCSACCRSKAGSTTRTTCERCSSATRLPIAFRSNRRRVPRAQPWVSTPARPRSAVLPGSRRAEVARLGGPFAATLAWLHERRPDIRFVAPMANAAVRTLFEHSLAQHAPGVPVARGRRPCAGGAGGRRRGPGRVGHRDARNGADQAADGGRVSPRAAHGVADAQHEADEGRLFRAAEPAGGTAGGAGVSAGRRATRRCWARRCWRSCSVPITRSSSRHSPRFTRTLRRDASARAADAILELRNQRSGTR